MIVIIIIIGLISVGVVGYYIFRANKTEAHEIKFKNNEKEGEN